MNKMMLVIDEPQSCGDCYFSYSDEYNDHWLCGACDDSMKIVDLNNPPRPEWCPLRPVPKKLTGDNSVCWIDVDEQPPKENDWILFYDGAACEYNFGLYKNGQFYDERDCLCECVRYWMTINPPT